MPWMWFREDAEGKLSGPVRSVQLVANTVGSNCQRTKPVEPVASSYPPPAPELILSPACPALSAVQSRTAHVKRYEWVGRHVVGKKEW